MRPESFTPVAVTLGAAYFLIQMRRFGSPVLRLGYESGVWGSRLAALLLCGIVAFGLRNNGWGPNALFGTSLMVGLLLFSSIPVELRPGGITSAGHRWRWERVVRYSWLDDRRLLLTIRRWPVRERTLWIAVPQGLRQRTDEVLAHFVRPTPSKAPAHSASPG